MKFRPHLTILLQLALRPIRDIRLNVNPLFSGTLTFPLPTSSTPPRLCACIAGRLLAAPYAANEKLPEPFAEGSASTDSKHGRSGSGLLVSVLSTMLFLRLLVLELLLCC